MLAVRASAAFVYETEQEFLSNGDFNADGRMDAVILDRRTGNARVGYQAANGTLAWSAPIPTGVAYAGSMATGRFLHTNRQSIAVTSLELNRVHVVDLSNASNTPHRFNTPHPALTRLVGLEAPYGTNGLPPQRLDWTAATAHDPGITLLDLLAYLIGDPLSLFQDQIAAEGHLSSGNPIQAGSNGTTLVASMRRGSNDTFVAHSYASSNVLYRVGLPAGSEFAFGHFRWSQDTQPVPALLFYVPGQSNILVQRVLQGGNGLALGAATITTFTAAVQRVYYIDEGTNGYGVVQFGNGAVCVRPGGTDQLQLSAGLGLGAAGNVITGVVPLGAGKFALLSGGSNSFASAQAQVFTKGDGGYVQTSSSPLPRTTSNGTRANIWLFANEPFVNSNPLFVASLHGGDWITSLSGLPGSVSIVAETDRGATNGLGNPAPQTLSSPSLNATYGLANQYHPAISLFTYSGVRSAEPVLITISPPPGQYEEPINVTFTTANPGADEVYYRLSFGPYQQYAGPFTLYTNTQVQFYGSVFGSSDRSSLQLANYTFTPKTPLLDTNAVGGGATNVPPVRQVTNEIPAYAYGTIFYNRRSGSTGSIWSIHFDGSGDRYITEGVRPRLSPDGRYLAFLREGNPFATTPVNSGNIWIRDLLNGAESRLITHTNLIVGFDWEYARTNLLFDDGCQILRADLQGNISPLPFVTGCFDDAPAISPLNGSMAFHNLSSVAGSSGIFVTDSGVTTKQRLDLAPLRPRRPAWSPEGTQLAFAHYQFSTVPQSPQDLYVVNPDGSGLFQITGFRSLEGFREGALWSPDGDALLGAAVVGGVNGIWVVPLTPDRQACGAPPYRLPTTPGDLIDFVGTVFVPPPPPQLFIRREAGGVTVFWRRTAFPVRLESSAALGAGASWAPVGGPFPTVGTFLEHFIAEPEFLAGRFYRLRLH